MGDNDVTRRNRSKPVQASAKIRSHFRIARNLEPIFTGSQVRLSPDNGYLLCSCEETGIKIVSSDNFSVVGLLKPAEEVVTCFCPLRLGGTDDNSENTETFGLITASHNAMLRHWRVSVKPDEELDAFVAHSRISRSWKAQPATPAGRICSLEVDESRSLLASAATDGSLRIWDLDRMACTHMLRGHTGVISLVRFFANGDLNILLTSAVGDAQLRAWDLNSGSNPTFVELNGHSSVVTGAVWSPTGHRMITVSRDQVIVVWKVGKSLEKLRTWPCYEQVESVFVHPLAKKSDGDDAFCVVTAGSHGQLRIWDVVTGKCLAKSKPIAVNEAVDVKMEVDDEKTSVGFLSAVVCGQPLDGVLCLTSDRRLVLYGLKEDEAAIKIEEKKQVPGDVGEVLDIVSLAQPTSSGPVGMLAVATTSPLIRVYDSSDWSCTFLNGHTEAVTSVASFARDQTPYLISGSRDNAVNIWQVGIVPPKVVARATGHTGAVLTVATISTGDFFVSAGVDLTIKVWQLPKDLAKKSASPLVLSCTATVKSHDKDVNSLALSPNGRFLGSGSQDKTAKIWLIENDHTGPAALQLLGVLRGHRRAIWSVHFSPIDQIMATSSADGTVKVWALSDLSCLRTFEGHEVAVLRCQFLNRGTQLVSTGADGVIRVWNLQTGDCVATLDKGHDDRAWALAAINDGQWLVTGSADDKLVVWQDYTHEFVEECTQRDHARALDAQRLDNLLTGRHFVQAFQLALSLNQPARLWRIVREVRIAPSKEGNDMPSDLLQEIIVNLDAASLAQLIRIVTAWNTNTRFVLEAQHILNIILRVHPIEDLLKVIKNDVPASSQQGLRDAVEALISYTQRHFARIDRLATQSAFIDFAWSQLKLLDDDMAQ